MTAILRIFGLPDSEAATATYYQNLATAIAADLLIVASLMVWEILGDAGPRKEVPQATQASPATPTVAVGEGEPTAAGGVRAAVLIAVRIASSIASPTRARARFVATPCDR